VIEDVRCHKFVHDVQVALVVDLLYQALDDGLVLFSWHGGLPSIELCNEGIIALKLTKVHPANGLSCSYSPECVEYMFSEVRMQDPA
jgi:hypothetical protein